MSNMPFILQFLESVVPPEGLLEGHYDAKRQLWIIPPDIFFNDVRHKKNAELPKR
jgi:hypothetical protein